MRKEDMKEALTKYICDNCEKELVIRNHFYGTKQDAGWLIVDAQTEMRIETYHFCSYKCLIEWANKHIRSQHS